MSYSDLQRAAILVEVEWTAGVFFEEWTPGRNGLVLQGAASSFFEVGAVAFFVQHRASPSFVERASSSLQNVVL